MAALIAFAVVAVYVTSNVAAISAAVVRRDGWHGWRHFMNS